MSIFFKMQQDSNGKKKVIDFLSKEYGGVGLNILEFIPENAVICNAPRMTKDEAIHMLSERISACEGIASVADISDAVIDREELGSTVVDGGIAFPHARTEVLTRLYIAVAVSKEGFDFGHEGIVHVVFLLVSNDEYASLYLLSLAALAKVIRKSENLAALINANDAKEVKDILSTSPLQMRAQMTVGDIMKWPKILLDPDVSLHKVSYMLEESSLDCAFVIDSDGVLLGEINDLDLLRVTAADMLGGEHERILLAKDAMQRKIPLLTTEDRIADAAMRMVDLRRNRLAVTDSEGKFIGEVIWSDLIGKMLTK